MKSNILIVIYAIELKQHSANVTPNQVLNLCIHTLCDNYSKYDHDS